eukprot:11228244-Lingulodinium_polyedra.AAC.1
MPSALKTEMHKYCNQLREYSKKGVVAAYNVCRDKDMKEDGVMHRLPKFHKQRKWQASKHEIAYCADGFKVLDEWEKLVHKQAVELQEFIAKAHEHSSKTYAYLTATSTVTAQVATILEQFYNATGDTLTEEERASLNEQAVLMALDALREHVSTAKVALHKKNEKREKYLRERADAQGRLNGMSTKELILT